MSRISSGTHDLCHDPIAELVSRRLSFGPYGRKPRGAISKQLAASLRWKTAQFDYARASTVDGAIALPELDFILAD